MRKRPAVSLRQHFLRKPVLIGVLLASGVMVVLLHLARTYWSYTMELRAVEIARSIDTMAMVTPTSAHLQHVARSLILSGDSIRLLVVNKANRRILASSDYLNFGTRLERYPDREARQMVEDALASGTFEFQRRSPTGRQFAILPLSAQMHMLSGENMLAAGTWLTPRWHSAIKTRRGAWSSAILPTPTGVAYHRIEMGPAQYAGVILVETSQDWVGQIVSGSFILAVLCLVASIAVVIASLWMVLRRHVFSPLLQLAGVIARMHAGDASARAEPTGVLEFDELGRQWNALLDQRAAADAEVKRHQEALIDARERAEAGVRTKSDFIATMSHELRTPLNSIIGFSEMLTAERFGALGSLQYREFAALIEKSAKGLLAVINSIIDLNRLDSGRLKVETHPFDPVPGIEHTLRKFDAQAAEQSVELQFASRIKGASLDADESLFRQMVSHLVGNAIKFNRPGGKAMVTLSLDRQGGMVLRVRDSGIGIPEGEIGRVAEPFHQVESGLARSHEGVGLGLTLVEQFARAHGARLAIRSREGHGTTAEITFPPTAVITPRPARKGALEHAA